MSEYKIERWDAVIFGENSTRKVPVIYFKPDEAFLEFAKNHNWTVMAEINGTGLMYDGKQIPGTVDQSSRIPNCRPNYFARTGYYVVSLESFWYGYPEPDKLGTVKFYGMKPPAAPKDKDKHVQALPDIEGDVDYLTRPRIGGVAVYGLGILAAVLVILWLVVSGRRRNVSSSN